MTTGGVARALDEADPAPGKDAPTVFDPLAPGDDAHSLADESQAAVDTPAPSDDDPATSSHGAP